MTEQEIIKDQDYGKLITPELHNYLMNYTDKSDRALAADRSGVGISVITQVRRRVANITENNSKGIIELIKIAVNKCDANIEDFREVKSQLSQMLITE